MSENKFVKLKLFTKYIKIEDADTDELLNLYLNAAQEVIEKYIGYELEEKIYTHASIHQNYIIAQAANVSELKINGNITPITKQKTNIVFFNKCENLKINDIEYKAGYTEKNIPPIISLTIMRIASLMVSEEGGDIALTGKSFGSEGGRTFISTRDYSKILKEIDGYRIL